MIEAPSNAWVMLNEEKQVASSTEGSTNIYTYKMTQDMSFVIMDSAGVETVVDSVTGETVIYNLNGVRVNPDNLTKGLYIINGKKVMVNP